MSFLAHPPLNVMLYEDDVADRGAARFRTGSKVTGNCPPCIVARRHPSDHWRATHTPQIVHLRAHDRCRFRQDKSTHSYSVIPSASSSGAISKLSRRHSYTDDTRQQHALNRVMMKEQSVQCVIKYNPDKPACVRKLEPSVFLSILLLDWVHNYRDSGSEACRLILFSNVCVLS